ncbi:hypothetical protein DFH06DRAFT_172601 [Mycena polygramma]|nr:hypothetical protein DFH06DRAFT_172601 [Mycena polygramma]
MAVAILKTDHHCPSISLSPSPSVSLSIPPRAPPSASSRFLPVPSLSPASPPLSSPLLFSPRPSPAFSSLLSPSFTPLSSPPRPSSHLHIFFLLFARLSLPVSSRLIHTHSFLLPMHNDTPKSFQVHAVRRALAYRDGSADERTGVATQGRSRHGADGKSCRCGGRARRRATRGIGCLAGTLYARGI